MQTATEFLGVRLRARGLRILEVEASVGRGALITASQVAGRGGVGMTEMPFSQGWGCVSQAGIGGDDHYCHGNWQDGSRL